MASEIPSPTPNPSASTIHPALTTHLQRETLAADVVLGLCERLWRLRHDTAREPGFAGVVHRQAGLQAAEVAGRRGEAGRGGAELARMRPVLGVVDHDEVAAGGFQPGIERPRLGAGMAARQHDHLVAGRQAQARRGRHRGAIAVLQHHLHVELGGRIVAALCRKRNKSHR